MVEGGAAVAEWADRVPLDAGGAGVAGRFVVYRFLDGSGTVLYVGMTGRWRLRLKEHRGKSPWFVAVADVVLEGFAAEADGRAREAELVATLAPLHNRLPGGGGRYSSDPAGHRAPASFTLSPATVALIGRLAAETGLSRSALVELAVVTFARRA